MNDTHMGIFTRAKERRQADANETQTKRLIEAARWHTMRYDNLRASLANRASFVVSVATILIAGVSFLFPWIADRKIYGGTTALILLGLGMLTSLIFAMWSIREACRGLLTSQPWRKIFGDGPTSFFYQHDDTVRELPSYEEFSASFENQSFETELSYATVNLWLCMKTHAYRYRFITNAVKQLQVALIAFAISVIVAAILGLMPL